MAPAMTNAPSITLKEKTRQVTISHTRELPFGGWDVVQIDILSIDTEGNDPLVLLGMGTALRRVRYLEFEYHKIGAAPFLTMPPYIGLSGAGRPGLGARPASGLWWTV
jgi:hypothetical protein